MRAVLEHHGTTLHLSGHSQWTSDGAEWSSAPGSVSTKIPGQVAIERAREGVLEFQVVLFEPSLVDEARAVLERPFLRPRMGAFDPRDPRAQPLLALHRLLLDGESAQSPPRSLAPRPLALEDAACEALHALVEVSSGPPAASLGSRATFRRNVARAKALLDERFTEVVGLEALAEHARLDKFRLCRAFREQVGLPPHAYVTHRRIARAQALLARGVPQGEVAVSVGFYDQSLLHRHFKRIIGVTPGSYARAMAQS